MCSYVVKLSICLRGLACIPQNGYGVGVCLYSVWDVCVCVCECQLSVCDGSVCVLPSVQ